MSTAPAGVPRIVEVRRNILKHNDEVARVLRARFQDAGVFVVSLVSSPGSGKTAFLEKTLTLLKHTHRPAALVGDLATESGPCSFYRTRHIAAILEFSMYVFCSFVRRLEFTSSMAGG